MGACITVAPAALAVAATRRVLAIMSVLSITADTAPCSTPPSVVKSFWYSMSTTAVLLGSIDMERFPSSTPALVRLLPGSRLPPSAAPHKPGRTDSDRRLEQPFAIGNSSRLRAARYAQLGHQVGHVNARSLVRDVERGPDLTVGAPVGDQPQDFELACGQDHVADRLCRRRSRDVSCGEPRPAPQVLQRREQRHRTQLLGCGHGGPPMLHCLVAAPSA